MDLKTCLERTQDFLLQVWVERVSASMHPQRPPLEILSDMLVFTEALIEALDAPSPRFGRVLDRALDVSRRLGTRRRKAGVDVEEVRWEYQELLRCIREVVVANGSQLSPTELEWLRVFVEAGEWMATEGWLHPTELGPSSRVTH